MKVWSDQALPRLINLVLGTAEVRRHREATVAGLAGTVIEIGFGSGLNTPLYPPAVKKVCAVEPSAVARRLAGRRIAASPVPVEWIGLDGESLPLEDASVDAALSTFTLCTIPDVGRGLAELRRVLRPGGFLHFLEHGLSSDPGTVAWQHRLDPLEQRLAGGCHLSRPIDRLLDEAGFEVRTLRRDLLHGARVLRPWAELYAGIAVSPADAA